MASPPPNAAGRASASPDSDSTFVHEALSESLAWAGAAPIGELPGSPTVYQLQDAEGRHLLLATTQHLRRAVAGRLSPGEAESPSRRADLAAVVRRVRWRRVSCAFEARWWHYRLARVLHPQDYRKRIGFRPAWFLHADWRQPIPEIRVSDRVWLSAGEFLGPWPSQRAATEALHGLWDVFDLCRYPEQIRRAPRGQRCAYYDMGRCDAPCDGSAGLTPYVERCRAAWGFAVGRHGGAAGWIEQAVAQMRAAAREQQFERAGLLKGQIAFAQRWLAEWQPRVRPLEALRYLIALPATRRKAWKLFAFRAGTFADGPLVKEPDAGATAREWLKQLSCAGETDDAVARMEQTWLLAHLLHSKEAETAAIVGLDGAAEGDHAFDAALASRSAGRTGAGKPEETNARQGPDA